MSNILTNLIPDLYQGLDEVSRELVGFIPAVARNSSAERAALGENIYVPISTALKSADVVPGMNVPEPDDFTVDGTSIVITKSKAVSFGLDGEEYKGLNNGVGANYVIGENFKQAIRALTNEIEKDIAAEAALGASRSHGQAGTTPFATDLKDAAQVRKILDDNGAPASDRSLIIDTAAGVNLRSLTQLTNVGDAGTSMTLRQGELLNLFGLSVKESAAVKAEVEVGSVSGATVGAALVGANMLKVTAGSGALKAGDYITLAGDTNKYMVVKAVAVANGAIIEIAKPGLRKEAEDGVAISVVAKSTHNVAFVRNAIQLVTRAPALPGGKDAAVDSYMMTDPRSGLTFEIRVYNGYRKMRAEVACAWGVKAIKPEFIAGLLG